MGNRVGIGPIGWVNDDLRDWGGERSGDDVLREIKALGYDGTEMSYKYPQDPAALREKLASHALVLAAAYRWTNFVHAEHQDEEIALARAHVDLCAAAGANFATLAEGGNSLHWDRRGEAVSVTPLDEAAWARLVESLHEIGRHARERGIRLTVHPHGGTAIESEAEIDRLFASLDPELAGYCLDTGHIAYGGGDPAAVTGRLADRVGYVHLKDIRAPVLQQVREQGWSFKQAVRANVFCTPGAGALDFDPVIAALRGAGYAGWYVVEAEQDPQVHDPLEVGGRAREFLRERYGL